MVVVLVLAALLLPVAASANPGEPHELWATHTGDDPRWSKPEFDDAAWPRVPLRSSWNEQGRRGYDGMVWFRRAVALDDDARLAGRRNDLGVLLGPPAYGGYEVYVDGQRIGRSRGWSSALAFGFPEVFRVPANAVARDRTANMALRVHRIGWASDRDPQSAPVSGVVTIGSYQALADGLRAERGDRLLSEVPQLVLAALFGVVFLQYLLLFGRRRKQIEYLWFALLALCFAINTFATTFWIYEVTTSRGAAVRLSGVTGHLAAALAIQFLWTFFSRPVSRTLRAYQLSQIVLAVFVGFWPDVRAVIVSDPARWVWLLPLLVVVTVRVVRESRLGDAEARIIAGGGIIMIVIEAGELLRNVLHLQLPFVSLAVFGFGAVIVAMSLALSLRFRRVHEELDRLRFRLEDEVLERTRELAEASHAKDEFLANISHEIRTPMNGVIGMAELLARTSLTPEQKAHLEAIEVSGRSLLTLLNDILDFSRLQSKKLTVEHRPFRVVNVVEECLEIMAPLAAGKVLTLGSFIAEGTVEAVWGDQHRTRQVLLNLLSNGIKFTREGRVDVAVGSRSLSDGRVEVRFSVTDTGLGISKEDLGRLFVAFQQLDGSSSRQHGGAGLGLAISKRLTELMGGAMAVDTAPGRGSTFHFTIVADPAAIPLPQPAKREALAPRPHALRILVAEDEAINQIVVLHMLRELGYHADSVTNGKDALQALEREGYDVILMDIQMPDMDGFEVTRRIRDGNGKIPHIIALTAHALSGDRERCLAAGMNGYLSKPVRMIDLQDALASLA
jgi:signal transduction histidine kinase/CheY-like chemotaxis protein